MQRCLKLASSAVLAAVAATACMGEEITDNGPSEMGGATSTMGGGTVAAAGGAVTPGGAANLGGATSIATGVGGSTSDTGTQALGGSVSAGGSSSVGNTTSPVGGATSAGGSTSKGGATSAGGSMSKGGATSAGGSTSKGGGTSKGGATSAGGSTSKGGSSSTGGVTSVGGATATGGTASSSCPEGNTLLCGILAEHNAARAAVNPAPTTPLPAMTWDATVATAAQAWADQCSFSHYIASGSNQGQNLYASTGTGTPAAPTPYTVVNAPKNSWVSEVQYYNYASNTCQSGQVCGHYTQVVWRNSTLLGCGIKYCTTNSPFSGFANWWIVVCNYSPAGNYNGQKPY